MRYAKILSSIALLCSISFNSKAEINDALAPTSLPQDALTKPLHTVTITTNSLEESLLFYREGMGLSVTGPYDSDNKVISIQRKLWDIPEEINWELYLLNRNEVAQTIQVRLLVLDRPTPSIHRSWNALELGPFSLGFPNKDQEALDKKIRQLGFGSLNKLESYQVPRPDKSLYSIDETIFNAPDFVHGVGIHRGGLMRQLGPVSSANGLGGPAYSAQMVENSDEMLAFFIDVLGLELRSDRIWESAGSEGALNVPDGTVFRFSIVYAKGAKTGHLLFVHYQNVDAIDNGITPRLPNRGIGAWSFPVTDLDQVIKNAKTSKVQILQEPISYDSPALGNARVATLLAPNGFLIELFEPR